MRQITIWKSPHTELNSEYGFITYQDWCERETVRLAKGNNRSFIIQGKDMKNGGGDKRYFISIWEKNRGNHISSNKKLEYQRQYRKENGN